MLHVLEYRTCKQLYIHILLSNDLHTVIIYVPHFLGICAFRFLGIPGKPAIPIETCAEHYTCTDIVFFVNTTVSNNIQRSIGQIHMLACNYEFDLHKTKYRNNINNSTSHAEAIYLLDGCHCHYALMMICHDAVSYYTSKFGQKEDQLASHVQH